MSILNQIPKPSFIFDPTMANESRGALAQVRRVENETGQESDAFTRNTSKYVINKAGVLVEVPENVPAVEFDKAFPKGYLAEPGATNLYTRPFFLQGTAGWTSPGTAIVENALSGQRGVGFGYKYSGTGVTDLFQTVPVEEGEDYTIHAWYFLEDQSSNIQIRFRWLNSSNDVITTNNVNIHNAMEFEKWTHIQRTRQAPAGAVSCRAYPVNVGSGAFNDTAGIVAFPMIEKGSVATSFVGADDQTASRGADSMIFENAEDLIGQQSGVILVDLDFKFIDGVSQTIIELSDGSTSNRLYLQNPTTGSQDLAVITTSLGASAVERTGTPLLSGIQKILVGYNDGEFLKIYINSQKLIEEGFLKPESLNNMALGSRRSEGQYVNSHIRKAYLWNNADWLTDELAERLTS